jgi:hypothetical protein
MVAVLYGIDRRQAPPSAEQLDRACLTIMA